MEKTRIELHLPEDMHHQLQLIADHNNRILENQIIAFLKETLEVFMERNDIEYDYTERKFVQTSYVQSRNRERFDLE